MAIAAPVDLASIFDDMIKGYGGGARAAAAAPAAIDTLNPPGARASTAAEVVERARSAAARGYGGQFDAGLKNIMDGPVKPAATIAQVGGAGVEAPGMLARGFGAIRGAYNAVTGPLGLGVAASLYSPNAGENSDYQNGTGVATPEQRAMAQSGPGATAVGGAYPKRFPEVTASPTVGGASGGTNTNGFVVDSATGRVVDPKTSGSIPSAVPVSSIPPVRDYGVPPEVAAGGVVGAPAVAASNVVNGVATGGMRKVIGADGVPVYTNIGTPSNAPVAAAASTPGFGATQRLNPATGLPYSTTMRAQVGNREDGGFFGAIQNNNLIARARGAEMLLAKQDTAQNALRVAEIKADSADRVAAARENAKGVVIAGADGSQSVVYPGLGGAVSMGKDGNPVFKRATAGAPVHLNSATITQILPAYKAKGWTNAQIRADLEKKYPGQPIPAF